MVRHEKFNKKIYERKKLKSPLKVGEEVLVLPSQLWKNNSPRKFYKSSVNEKVRDMFYNKQTKK